MLPINHKPVKLIEKKLPTHFIVSKTSPEFLAMNDKSIFSDSDDCEVLSGGDDKERVLALEAEIGAEEFPGADWATTKGYPWTRDIIPFTTPKTTKLKTSMLCWTKSGASWDTVIMGEEEYRRKMSENVGEEFWGLRVTNFTQDCCISLFRANWWIPNFVKLIDFNHKILTVRNSVPITKLEYIDHRDTFVKQKML